MSRLIKGLMLAGLMLAGASQAQTVEYIHTDALGSVVAVTNAQRKVQERREYEPYGHQLTPAIANGPGYTGHVQDAATGLVYMQQRYYDAQIGRFLSVDPVVAHEKPGQNFNRYWYANNNPYIFTDPDGRQSFPAFRSFESYMRQWWSSPVNRGKFAEGINEKVTFGLRDYERRQVALNSVAAGAGVVSLGSGPGALVAAPVALLASTLAFADAVAHGNVGQSDIAVFVATSLPYLKPLKYTELGGVLLAPLEKTQAAAGVAASVAGAVGARQANKSDYGDNNFEGISVYRVEGRIDSNRLDGKLRHK